MLLRVARIPLEESYMRFLACAAQLLSLQKAAWKNLVLFCACFSAMIYFPLSSYGASSKEAEHPNIIDNSSSRFSIHIEYPNTGHPAADEEVAFWANQQALTFIRGIEDIPDLEGSRYSLRVTYSVNRVSDRCVSIRFKILVDMDDAQTGVGIATFTYDLRDGRSLNLYDMFNKSGSLLPFMSIYCRQALKEKFYNAPPDVFEYIDEVTTPELTNFSFFTVTPEGISIFFPMNPSAGSPLTEVGVSIPMADLKRFEPIHTYWSRSGVNKTF